MTQLTMQDATLALMAVPGIGSTLYSRLVRRFGSPRKVWRTSASALSSIRSLPEKVINLIVKGPDLERLAGVRDALLSMGAWVVTVHDPEYPTRLRDISQAPPVIFGLGDRKILKRKSLAMVGSRKASTYGRRVAEEFAASLSLQGYCIVSGLAPGIDSAAHKGALEGGGPTVAVKGCGLDVNYPARNKALSERIAGSGAVITEFFPGTTPEPRNFPARNRIISGLSCGVLVVEAGLKSGSLITAYLGLEQGRDVMAVPGSIFSYNSLGCHRLIREGAALVTSVQEVTEELGEDFLEKGLAQTPEKVKVSSLSPEEHRIVDKLEAEPQHIDEIAARCQVPAAQVGTVLLRLELKGVVMGHAGGKYSKKIQFE